MCGVRAENAVAGLYRECRCGKSGVGGIRIRDARRAGHVEVAESVHAAAFVGDPRTRARKRASKSTEGMPRAAYWHHAGLPATQGFAQSLGRGSQISTHVTQCLLGRQWRWQARKRRG